MDNFTITTTPTLEGYRITRYLGPVVVPSVGAGDMIKDWLAGFTDIFGGKSRSYQKVFAKFINQGVKQMADQARQYGANAIVNFRIETTNISKGKSVISVLLYGTAVVVEPACPACRPQSGRRLESEISAEEDTANGKGVDRQAG